MRRSCACAPFCRRLVACPSRLARPLVAAAPASRCPAPLFPPSKRRAFQKRVATKCSRKIFGDLFAAVTPKTSTLFSLEHFLKKKEKATTKMVAAQWRRVWASLSKKKRRRATWVQRDNDRQKFGEDPPESQRDRAEAARARAPTTTRPPPKCRKEPRFIHEKTEINPVMRIF